MLEVTCKSAETELGVDFAEIYEESTLYQWVQILWCPLNDHIFYCFGL